MHDEYGSEVTTCSLSTTRRCKKARSGIEHVTNIKKKQTTYNVEDPQAAPVLSGGRRGNLDNTDVHAL